MSLIWWVTLYREDVITDSLSNCFIPILVPEILLRTRCSWPRTWWGGTGGLTGTPWAPRRGPRGSTRPSKLTSGRLGYSIQLKFAMSAMFTYTVGHPLSRTWYFVEHSRHVPPTVGLILQLLLILYNPTGNQNKRENKTKHHNWVDDADCKYIFSNNSVHLQDLEEEEIISVMVTLGRRNGWTIETQSSQFERILRRRGNKYDYSLCMCHLLPRFNSAK